MWLLAFLLKILLGAVAVSILFAVGYGLYRIGVLIPDSRVTKPVKNGIVSIIMVCLVLFVVLFPTFDPGAPAWIQHINSLIPPDLRIWKQATG